jgi:hypothetical protein
LVGDPKQASKDNTFDLEGEKFTVYKGDWFCNGVWLDKLKGAPGWWTVTGQPCIVRLETVVNADVNFLEQSETNPIPTRLSRSARRIAENNGAWRMSDTDSLWIIQEARRRSAMEYDEELARTFQEEMEVEATWWARNGDGVKSDDE